jgi:hypothetical protein
VRISQSGQKRDDARISAALLASQEWTAIVAEAGLSAHRGGGAIDPTKSRMKSPIPWGRKAKLPSSRPVAYGEAR